MSIVTGQHPVFSRLERPQFGPNDAPSLWADEAIWGHRLYDEQTPWLTILECLGIALAEERKEKGHAFQDPVNRRLSYLPLTQLRLRNILFNSPKLPLFLERGGGDEGAWTAWEADMRAEAGGLQDPDFTYVRAHFQSFRDFVAVVQFLRSSTVEGANNKRWSSQFVFPFGPSALYEDLNVSGLSVSTDRRFFGRTGELLYLMLCRSGYSSELRDAVCSRFLDPSLSYGRLIQALQGPDEEAKNIRTGAYLPYETLPDFKQLAEDWLAILSRSLPGYDALPHLVSITGLHLVLYLLRRAKNEVGESGAPTLVAEIVSPRRTIVRDLSADSYAHNGLLPQRAVEHWIRRITDTPEWHTAVSGPDPIPSVVLLLRSVFDWPDESDDEVRAAVTPTKLLESLLDRAVARHRQHLANCHGNWGRAIGLSSRRASRRTRYAPTDALLKTLVICTVDGRLELREFVELLYRRYGIVVGDQQANNSAMTDQADPEAFAENQTRLEERLASLGLVRRLSDQCAYVENPFAGVRK